MSSDLIADVEPVGTFDLDGLRVKQIKFFDKDGEYCGCFLLGTPQGNCLMTDGVEIAFVQKKDPPQIRLATRDQTGAQTGGVIQACVLRNGEDVFENLLQLQFSKADDSAPDEHRGQLVIKVRTNQGPDEDGMQTAAVFSTAYMDGGPALWTGLANFAGDLFKFANAGDPPPYMCTGTHPAPLPPTPTADDTLWALDGLSFQQQQGDTNLVVYAGTTPWSKVGVTAVWSWMSGPIELAGARDARPFYRRWRIFWRRRRRHATSATPTH
jgi:hypothetical protein